MSIHTELNSSVPVSKFKSEIKHRYLQYINSFIKFLFPKHTQKSSYTTAQAVAAPTDFSELCHSLRTPLNAIIGFSELMKAQIYGPLGHNKYQDYSCAIAQSGEELLAQIEKLLNERGEQLPNIQISEIDTITQNASRSLKSIVNQKSHHLIAPSANNNSIH